jgi:hypothetical protein
MSYRGRLGSANETIWLTWAPIAELLQVTVPTVNET